MLRVKGLTKRFGKKVANENISLSLNPGEIGILLGPNGAGKSTAIKCILGLLRFDGEVTIGGYPAKSPQAKKILGYVPEFPCLYEMLTVKEHFEFIIRAYRLDRVRASTLAAELMDRFRLTDVLDTLCKDLSKGMQQKVSIICALLPEPKLLMLDEPMLGLDPHAIKELRSIVTELATEKGVAVLISTHMIATVEGIWEKAYIMNKGHVISCHRKNEMIGMWADSLERIFFAETESYDPAWQMPPEPETIVERAVTSANASANVAKPVSKKQAKAAAKTKAAKGSAEASVQSNAVATAPVSVKTPNPQTLPAKNPTPVTTPKTSSKKAKKSKKK